MTEKPQRGKQWIKQAHRWRTIVGYSLDDVLSRPAVGKRCFSVEYLHRDVSAAFKTAFAQRDRHALLPVRVLRAFADIFTNSGGDVVVPLENSARPLWYCIGYDLQSVAIF